MDLKVIDSQSSPWLPHRKYTGVYARSVVDSAISSDLEVREVRITPGAEISLHTHEGSAETFYVLSGTGTVYTGSESVPCQPGSCFHAQAGTAHSVKNTSEQDMHLLAIFTPPLDQARKPDAGLYKVIATVRSVGGHCGFGHQVGDQIVFDGDTVDGRICMSALYSFLPKVFALRHGADFPWLDAAHKDVATHACPDAQNPVVFEIRRVREAEGGKKAS